MAVKYRLLAGAPLGIATAMALLVACCALPESEYYARNTSDRPLSCRTREAGGPWSPSFVIAAGGEFTRRARGHDTRLELVCSPPAAAPRYVLEPGERYAFFEEAGKPIALRRVTNGQ